MWWHDPRTLLSVRALFLDWLGQLILEWSFCFLDGWITPSDAPFQLDRSRTLIVFCLILYPLLGWLFGSYTVLRWRRLAFPCLFQRLLITAIATLVFVEHRALASQSWRRSLDSMNQVFRCCGCVLLTTWSLLMRIALRRGLLCLIRLD